MTTLPLLRATHLVPIVASIRDVGAPVERLMARCKLPLLALDDPHAVVPELRAWELLGRVAHHEGIEDFGIRAAEHRPLRQSEPEFFGLLATSPSLWLALHTFCRTVVHISTGPPYTVERFGDGCVFRRGKLRGEAGAEQTELYVLRVLIEAVLVTLGRAWWPKEVMVGAANVGRVSRMETLADARVRPSKDWTGIFVPAALLAEKPPGRSGTALPVPGPLPGEFVDALSATLGAYLRDGRPSLALAAEITGMSERTLQRRLGESGQSFSGLLDEVRLAKALPSLRCHDVSVTELAYDLGFSDIAHFTRAFRRWIGLSPRAYRRQHALH